VVLVNEDEMSNGGTTGVALTAVILKSLGSLAIKRMRAVIRPDFLEKQGDLD
jgi:hypothetical protein